MTDKHQAQSYPLRMPADLKERVVGAAKESGRSLHAEIVARLQASFAMAPQHTELVQLVNAAVDERIGRITASLPLLRATMEASSGPVEGASTQIPAIPKKRTAPVQEKH